MEEKQTVKPIKKGFWHWVGQVFQNNQDLDSTGMLFFIGGGYILHQVLCYFNAVYATTAMAVEITKVYDEAVMMMVLYFFAKNRNGGGQK